MKLSYKISVVFIFIGISTLLASFYISYLETEQSLTKISFERLTSIRDSKKREIERYFNTIQHQAITLSKNLMTVQSVKAFSHGFSALEEQVVNNTQQQELREYYQTKFIPKYQRSTHGLWEEGSELLPSSNAARQLQYAYIASNPESSTSRSDLIRAEQNTSYNHNHAIYHPIFKHYLENYKFYDVFLVNMDGNVIYSVNKEIDFATNLLYGPHRQSGLANAFRGAQKLGASDDVFLVDFSPYVPSYGKPAAFITSQIYSADQPIGVLVFQLSITEIKSIMSSNGRWHEEGYGRTGETYIVADDYGMRNDSRFLIEEPERYLGMLEKLGFDQQVINNIRTFNTSIHFQKVRTLATTESLQGKRDTKIIDDYRGVSVLSSYTPLEISGVKWALISEIDKDEVFQPIKNIKQYIILFSIFLIALLIMTAMIVSRKLTKPLTALVERVKNIAAGDFEQHIAVTSQDEVGELASAFNDMSGSLMRTTVSKNYLDQILFSMNEALFVIKSMPGNTHDLHIQTINQATAKLIGLDEKDILDKSINVFIDEEELFSALEFRQLMRNNAIQPTDKTLVDRLGNRIPVLFSASLMKDQEEVLTDTIVCVCVAQDITERKRAEEKLKLSSTVFNNSLESIVITDALGEIIDCNPAFEFSTGYYKQDLLHTSIDNLKVKESEVLSLKQIIQRTKAHSTWRGELTGYHKNGDELPFIVSCSAVVNNEGIFVNYVVVMSDITDLKNKEQQILHIANHDALTGLPNRNLLKDRLSHALKQRQRNEEMLAVLYIDLDGFKAVNDVYGHQAGDEVLMEVAERMRQQIRDSDTVSRLGGDEFAIILDDISHIRDATHVSEKILKAINHPIQLTMATVHVSCSIGIACYPQHAADMETLIKLADSAMYHAKSSGKNNIKIPE